MWMLVMIVLGTSVVIEPMILSDNMACFSQNTREMVAITLMALSIMLFKPIVEKVSGTK